MFSTSLSFDTFIIPCWLLLVKNFFHFFSFVAEVTPCSSALPVLQSRPKGSRLWRVALHARLIFNLLVLFRRTSHCFCTSFLCFYYTTFSFVCQALFQDFLGFCFQRAGLLFLNNQPLFQEIHCLYFGRNPTPFPILYLYYSTCVAVCQEIFSTFLISFCCFLFPLPSINIIAKFLLKINR